MPMVDMFNDGDEHDRDCGRLFGVLAALINGADLPQESKAAVVSKILVQMVNGDESRENFLTAMAAVWDFEAVMPDSAMDIH